MTDDAATATAAVTQWRVGEGWDVHALVSGRKLILGGVHIEHTHGLLGHSDADALLHALTDALLGAASLGDIGALFPDTDPRYQDADSATLLAEAARRARALGWQIANVDGTVVAQAPRLTPYKKAMCERIAQILDVGPDQVNVKAKTAEGLGPVGQGACIEARAVALLVRAAPANNAHEPQPG
ncbi:MAG: 2-C-methyl-D-erythritol 2,4-cyclodiphosphate synthase [Burkholderiaceae bacterium]|jgi:2-C-methyl-D-erythritol 2,4-cyclodiphosphate synthase|nr:2-C-methyl-D-erythritol 2,4-cyclodiphosphate synthase [Burkholderiaceae bacterium]